MSLDSLARALRDAVDKAPKGAIVATYILFGIRYANELRGVSAEEVVRKAGLPNESMGSEIRKGVKLADFVTVK